MRNTLILTAQQGVVAVAKNADGGLCVYHAPTLGKLMADWEAQDDGLPEDEARVYFASYNGVPLDPYKYASFESLLVYLNWLQGKERKDSKTGHEKEESIC